MTQPTPEQRARKIVDGCIQELRFGGEHTDMSQVEPVRQIALDQLRDRIAAALVEAGGPRRSCPCLHTEPCQPDCTCVKPFMSHGCSFCCSYGSAEQRRTRAEHLRKLILLGIEVEAGGVQGERCERGFYKCAICESCSLAKCAHGVSEEPAGPQGEYECDGVNCPPRAHDHKVLDAQADLISREVMAQWVDGQKLFWMERQKNAKGNDEHFYNGKVAGADFIAAKIRALPAAPAGQQGDLISREAAIRVVQQSFRPAHTYASENADRYYAQDEGQRMVVTKACDAIRNLPAAHPTGECVWTRRQRGDHFWYTTECATVHDAMRFGEFCPYCGKQLVEHPTREK